MSLRTRLRILIVAFAAMVVIAISGVYLYDFARLAFHDAHSRALLVAKDVAGYVSERVNDDITDSGIHPATIEQFRAAAENAMRADDHIQSKLRMGRASYYAVLNIEISGPQGVIAAADPASAGAGYPTYDFEALQRRDAFLNLFDLFWRRQDYSTTIPLGAVGASDPRPMFHVKVIIQSVLLSQMLEPTFYKLAAGFFIGLAGFMFLAALLPSLFFGPLERLAKRIELISSGESAELPPPARPEAAEFAAVQSKLNVLGQQYRGARQNAMELRRNVEQLLERLEQTVLFFDSSGRLTMSGKSVERLIGVSPEQITGRTVEQVFEPNNGHSEIADAVRLRRPWRDHVVTLRHADANPLRALVSVEPLASPDGSDLGTLVTLRDAESRRQIESQLDISSRLAALGQLTSGVAHEIKNPLNAIAVHLEVLKSRQEDAVPEIDVISREIKRLDHVVKTFLNFNKPLELHVENVGLRALLEEVVTLVAPDAQSKGIDLATAFDENAWIGADRDLVKQAVLNVVVNAIEAMPGGGRLALAAAVEDDECVISVSDTGPGIPAAVRKKIFNLYYTTKTNGSGIGLAMTFRVVQLHGGTIDLAGEEGTGASFRLRFPRLAVHEDGPLLKAAGSGRKS